jgi:hypothetical protein
MNTTKQKIQLLEKLTGKKVILKENVEDSWTSLEFVISRDRIGHIDIKKNQSLAQISSGWNLECGSEEEGILIFSDDEAYLIFGKETEPEFSNFASKLIQFKQRGGNIMSKSIIEEFDHLFEKCS